jgi:spore coat protein U domain-containing protein, fimbrial subunit CupE1/2/3/6
MRRALLTVGAAVVLALTSVAPARAACTISSTPLLFGVYNVFATTPLDSTGSLTFRCGSTDKDIVITLDRGGAPTFNPRRMLNGSEPLTYNLYLDAARTTIWGDGTGGTQAFTEHNPQGNNRDFVVPIYGRIPAGQDVRSGSYTNTITVTIQF